MGKNNTLFKKDLWWHERAQDYEIKCLLKTKKLNSKISEEKNAKIKKSNDENIYNFI